MERLRRRPEPAAIDITWVSCRGVRSSLPFHTPCLYASIFVVWSSAWNAQGHRRHHRVKTPTDRAGGENPEWDAPLRLYLPDAASSPPKAAAGKNDKKDGVDDGSSSSSDVLLVRFELKAEVAVLGDVHAASAAVPVPDLVADGRTRRVSYQLVGPDGRQPNGVISFSYAFHERIDDDDNSQSSDGGEPATPHHPTSAASTDVYLPPPTIVAAAPRLYPEIEWALTEQPAVYPPVTAENNFTIVDTQLLYYPPAPPSPAPPAEPASVYPPAPPAEPARVYPPAPPAEPAWVYPPAHQVQPASVYPPVPEKSFCSVYPPVVEPVKATALYPTVDLAPVSYYPSAPAYGVECGYAVAPGWGDRCSYG